MLKQVVIGVGAWLLAGAGVLAWWVRIKGGAK